MPPSKLPDVTTTIFSVMSALAKRHGAINLSQGFPEYEPHPALLDAVDSAMRGNHNQYAPLAGNALLRERLADKTETLYGARVNPEIEITITAGATQAIFTAIMASVHEGDEVILFAPAFDSYAPAIRLAGGRPVFCSLQPPGYAIDWQEVKRLLSPRTRMILINSPHNPTGTVLGTKDLDALAVLTADTDIVILSDEVYEHIIFDNISHESVLRHPALAARSFVIGSFGKTYHVTGWKVGYCIAPLELSAEFRKVHQFNVFCVNSVAQAAFAEILLRKELYLELGEFYRKKRDFFFSAMKNSRFRLLPCEGTYFQLASYDTISDEADVEFVKRLTIDHGVAAIPASAFYPGGDDHRIIRFCFAKEEKTLYAAAERLRSL